ncbi:hypothetical protein M2408_001882 [Sphingobacterium sp. BIGb0165]|nr:hypothetical protein [Sphingobacterium sp. BIGb0165]
MFCKNYRFILFSLVFLATTFVSCNNRNRGEWRVSDVSKDTFLNAETNISDAITMIFKIQGHIDDSIKVQGVAIADA